MLHSKSMKVEKAIWEKISLIIAFFSDFSDGEAFLFYFSGVEGLGGRRVGGVRNAGRLMAM